MRLLLITLITVLASLHVQSACMDDAQDCNPKLTYHTTTIDHSMLDAEYLIPCEQLQRDEYDTNEEWDYANETCDNSIIEYVEE